MKRSLLLLPVLVCLLLVPHAWSVSTEDYDSLQAAIDANPGGVVEVAAGEHRITAKLRIASDDTVLTGYGTIVSENPDEPILEIEHAKNVRVSDLTFTRTPETQDCTSNGIFVYDAEGVEIRNVHVLENRSRAAAIELRETRHCTVTASVVRNYKRIAIDDRMDSELYGYAFRAIDGTGILVQQGRGARITDNRILEDRFLATEADKEAHDLGRVVEKASERRELMPSSAWRDDYVNNWHQGSGIVVTGPEDTSHVLVARNYLEHCAQGIDLHADHVVCSENIVDHGMMGVKATHGSRNLIIANNHISHVDLWGILLNPGAASHAGGDEKAPNVDGGTVISGNVITDYGYGNEYWNWGGSYAIALYDGQLRENPPLRDVVVSGNMVYNTGRDTGEAPRYRYAVWMGSWHIGKSPNLPEDVVFSGNIFHPGTEGVSNVPLE